MYSKLSLITQRPASITSLPIITSLPNFKPFKNYSQLQSNSFKHSAQSEKTSSETSTTNNDASEEQKQEYFDDCEYNIGLYCSIDTDGKRVETRSLKEMEQDFLNAMRTWYFEGRAIMSDDEFENLKEELIWQGSEIPNLSTEEQKFLEASMSYAKGERALSDEEYDKLKSELKRQGSFVTEAGPRCSIRSKNMYSDLKVDYLRMTLLNVPAVTAVLSVLFFFDDITGFEITQLIELPEPWGILILWGVVLPACFVLSQQLTNFILRDGLILKGPCPNCATDNLCYFGNIFTVEGNKEKATIKCPSCDTQLEFDTNKREIMVVADNGN